MLTRIGAISVIFSYLVGCGSQQVLERQERAHLHLKIGTAHLANGNYPLALKELLNAHEQDPDNKLVQNNLALAYFVRNKLVDAERHARRALQLDPAYTEARNNLARILIEQGDYPQAIQELKTCVNDLTYAFPDRSWSNLGMAYFKNQDFEKAKEAIRQAISINDQNCISYNYYGRTLYEEKQYMAAAQAFDRSVSLCKDPRFDEPRYYGALSYYQSGNREEALTRLNELLKSQPDGIYSKQARGIIELMK